VALGADRRRIVATIFSRALGEVAIGVVAGGLLIISLMYLASDGRMSIRQIGVMMVYSAIMMGVCMLACIVPTRRALRIEPTEALRVSIGRKDSGRASRREAEQQREILCSSASLLLCVRKVVGRTCQQSHPRRCC